MTHVVGATPTIGGGWFAPQEFETRLANTRRLMAERGHDVLLVASPENIYYLTGLTHQGHFAFTLLVVPMEGRPLVVARGMEAATLAMQVPDCDHVPFTDAESPASAVVRALGRVTTVGDQVAVELGSMHLPVAVWEAVREQTGHLRYVDAGLLVSGLRLVKSPAEIACVRACAVASSRAMDAGIAAVRADASTSEIAAEIYAEMMRSGSEYPGFAPLIRTRTDLLCEHVTSMNTTVPYGDQVFLELSASVARYHAPLTRMVYLGSPPVGTERAAEIALDGLYAVRDALRPGTTAGEVYAAWEEVVHAGTGNPAYHRHHCGYLVGLGFPPGWMGGAVTGLRAGSSLVIQPGMTFHVLSWLFDQQPADYVLSDTVVVGETGSEIVTTSHPGPLVVADLAA